MKFEVEHFEHLHAITRVNQNYKVENYEHLCSNTSV